MDMGLLVKKLPKGRYQCRVSMPRGVHEGRTNPIPIIMNAEKNCKRDKKRPTFAVFEVDEEIKIKLSTSKQLGQGQLCHDHFKGPIVWEQQRFEHDTYFVEQNLLTTMPTLSTYVRPHTRYRNIQTTFFKNT